MPSLLHTSPVGVNTLPHIDPVLYIRSVLRKTFRVVESLTRNTRHTCFASMGSLGRMIGKCEKTARRHVAELVRLNVVRRVTVPGGIDHLFILPPDVWNVYPECPADVRTYTSTESDAKHEKTTRQTRKSAAFPPCPTVTPQPDSVVVPCADASERREAGPEAEINSQVENNSSVEGVPTIEPLTGEEAQTVRALVEQRVPALVAAQAVRQDARRAQETLRALLRAQKAASGVRNPGGWFRAAWTATERWEFGQDTAEQGPARRYRVAEPGDAAPAQTLAEQDHAARRAMIATARAKLPGRFAI